MKVHRIKKTAHQVWPSGWTNRLPDLAGDYRAVLRALQHQTLIVMPKGRFNNTLPTVSLRPNANYKGEKVWRVVSLGSASIRNVKQAEHPLVAGKPEEKWQAGGSGHLIIRGGYDALAGPFPVHGLPFELMIWLFGF